jgi:hypothetical protein
MPAMEKTVAMTRLPPDTVEIAETLSSRRWLAKRRSTPIWNTAARMPPPESAKPIR